jgi:hypothetical protein
LREVGVGQPRCDRVEMKFSKLFQYAIVSIGMLSVGGCTSKVLPMRDAMAFSAIEENDDNGKKIITVSGFSGDSSMGVYKISSEKHSHRLLIKVHETLVRGTSTGTFKYSVEIKSNINYVCFGRLSDVIWRRR